LSNSTKPSNTDPAPVNPRDWVIGSPEAPVNLILYCDFECPDCRTFYPELKATLDEAEEIAVLVYRHLPLTDVHPYALDAAKTAEAAGKQGKFPEVYTALFETEEKLTKENLFAIAKSIGLNMDQFEKDFEETAFDGVFDDVEGARKIGLGATPTLFLNGTRYDGRFTYEALSEAIADL